MSPRKAPLKENSPPIFLHDEKIRQNYSVVAGLDEAGRGPLAGPVVAAAVVLPSGLVIEGVRDSKKVAEKERKNIFWDIVQMAYAVGVGMVEADTIDRINILQSTMRAMKMAVEDLGMKPDILLIDAVTLREVGIKQESIIRGESVCKGCQG
jgi:ribonuclease HII